MRFWVFAGVVVAGLVGVGCGPAFEVRAEGEGTDAGSGDTSAGAGGGDAVDPNPGTPATCGDRTCEAPSVRCEGDLLVSSKPSGCEGDVCRYATESTPCGASGCCTDRCCGVTPSNAGDYGTFAVPSSVVREAKGAFDTDADCTAEAALGVCEARVPNGGGVPACVCRADALTIGDLTVRGSRALVLLVGDRVAVEGTLDVAAVGATAGPGAGFDVHVDPAENPPAGGSFGSRGGRSVTASAGTEALVPLLGGMRGQSACEPFRGGGGGGAIQISAGQAIVVSGVVHAGGGGGRSLDDCWAGTSGGSGGAILLEAPSVTVTGTLAANGGAGAGGRSETVYGGVGEDGRPDTTAARGGQGSDDEGCLLFGYTVGGDGGPGSVLGNPGSEGQLDDAIVDCIPEAYVGPGGSGGGAGRIRINTGASGCSCGGQLTPPASFGALAAG